MVDRLEARHLEQPGGEAGVAAEAADALGDGDQHVLGHVVDGVGVDQQAADRGAGDRKLVDGTEQQLERLRRTGAGGDRDVVEQPSVGVVLAQRRGDDRPAAVVTVEGCGQQRGDRWIERRACRPRVAGLAKVAGRVHPVILAGRPGRLARLTPQLRDETAHAMGRSVPQSREPEPSPARCRPSALRSLADVNAASCPCPCP